MKRIFLLALALFAIAGCCSAPKDYVDADRLTYEAIAPVYEDYVQEDPKLTQEQRDRLLRTVKTWKARLDSNK